MGGHFVGGSRGGESANCREEAAAGRSAVIVTVVLHDSADNYLSERFWEEA
jgi:cysteine synthase